MIKSQGISGEVTLQLSVSEARSTYKNVFQVTQQTVKLMNGGTPLISSAIQPTSSYNFSYDENTEVEYTLTGDVKLEQEMTYPIEFSDECSQADVKFDVAEDTGAEIDGDLFICTFFFPYYKLK